MISAKLWHNTAAKYAMQRSHRDASVNPVHAGRNYQFLHLEHFAKSANAAFNKPFALHLSQLCAAERHRGDGKARNLIHEFVRRMTEHTLNNNGIVTNASNFPAYSSYLTSEFNSEREKTYLADSVRYDELRLELNQEKLFQSAAKLGSIEYFIVATK